MKIKVKNIRYIRYQVQGFGILLTIMGFLTDYPMVNSILLGVLIIMGPVFCEWICPFDTLQDVSSKLSSKLGIKKYVMPAKVKTILAFLRYLLLIITIFISVDFIFNILSLDPRANFTTLLGGKTLTIAGVATIFIFFGSSMLFERPFCNYLCIEGEK